MVSYSRELVERLDGSVVGRRSEIEQVVAGLAALRVGDGVGDHDEGFGRERVARRGGADHVPEHRREHAVAGTGVR